ncbi:hypothetical protein HpMS107_10670 [Helicobacter pylori]
MQRAALYFGQRYKMKEEFLPRILAARTHNTSAGYGASDSKPSICGTGGTKKTKGLTGNLSGLSFSGRGERI